MFGPKREEVTGDWRRLLYEELNNLYSSLNVTRKTIQRRNRLTGNEADMEKINSHNNLVEKLKGRHSLRGLGVYGKIILKCISNMM